MDKHRPPLCPSILCLLALDFDDLINDLRCDDLLCELRFTMMMFYDAVCYVSLINPFVL